MSLPIISLARLTGSDDERRVELEALREATHSVGFFYLTDTGLPAEQAPKLFRAAREFFDQPTVVKQEIAIENSPHYRGYTSLGDERTQGKTDWREQIDLAVERTPGFDEDRPWTVLNGPNQWNDASLPLKNVVEGWLAQTTRISQNLLEAWAESLGQRPDFFTGIGGEAYEALKVIHYPELADYSGEIDQGVGAHKDPGVLTLLLLEPGSTGLQVDQDGAWEDVEAIPDTFVVNIGELLEWATDGYLVATKHRVLPTRAGHDRYSIPFFYYPSLDERFPKLELPEELRAETRGVGSDLHGEQIFDQVGRNILKSRLRAHPNVTERFHSELAAALGAAPEVQPEKV